jgi:tryptophan 6-halogenase
VEPLESTGIFFIHYAIEQLVKYFPGTDWDPSLRAQYNSAVGNVMDGVREFLVLHYRAAKRQDNQYWRDTKTRAVPDALAERLERWHSKVPDAGTVYPRYHGLPPYSYNCILLGMGGHGVKPSPALDLIDEKAALTEFQLIADKAKGLVQKLPTQNEYFRRMRNEI